MERRLTQVRSERLERARTVIAERLKPVCAHLSEDEFEKLVEQAANFELKYALRSEKWDR